MGQIQNQQQEIECHKGVVIMRISLKDGIVVFATHFLTTTITEGMLEVNKTPLRQLQIRSDGVLCFSEQEKNKAEEILIKLNIPFTVEELVFTQEQKDKVKDIKYNSRSEAIAHLQNKIEMPESEIIPFLKKERDSLKNQLDAVIIEKDEIKAKNKQTEDALLSLMFNKK